MTKTSTTTTKRPRTTTAKKPTVPVTTQDEVSVSNDTPATSEIVIVNEVAPKKEYSPTDFIIVRNGFNGRLVYKSKHTGELYVWESFGAEQDLEFRELKNARNSCKVFFVNNWFLIDDRDVLVALGVDRFYKNSLTFEKFDEIFSKSPSEIERIVSALPDGQKESLAHRARQMVRDDQIDSMRVMRALERSLDIELIAR